MSSLENCPEIELIEQPAIANAVYCNLNDFDTLYASNHSRRLYDVGILQLKSRSRAAYYVPGKRFVQFQEEKSASLSWEFDLLSGNFDALSGELSPLYGGFAPLSNQLGDLSNQLEALPNQLSPLAQQFAAIAPELSSHPRQAYRAPQDEVTP